MIQTFGATDPRTSVCVDAFIHDDVVASVDHHDKCESTNSLALDFVCDHRSHDNADPASLPRLFIADLQTAGRGRHGRQWLSQSGDLAFSLLIDNRNLSDAAIPMLSIAVGVSVAQAIEFQCAPLEVRLKWPNDIMIGGGKAGGILLERPSTAPHLTVIGIGINVSTSPTLQDQSEASDSMATASSQPTQSLSQIVGYPVDRVETLDATIRRMTEWLDALDQQQDQTRIDSANKELMQQFRKRCCLTGETVRFYQNGIQRTGHCQGIDHQGALVVRCESDELRLTSGEVMRMRTI